MRCIVVGDRERVDEKVNRGKMVQVNRKQLFFIRCLVCVCIHANSESRGPGSWCEQQIQCNVWVSVITLLHFVIFTEHKAL